MGKRVAVPPAAESQYTTPPTRSIRKRKRNVAAAAAAKSLRLSSANNSYWHENDDEDSSSNDTAPPQAAQAQRNQSSKHANNSSILLNASLNATVGAGDATTLNESPKPVYTLRPSVVNGTILYDLMRKPWRLGRPIGKGNFGELFLASDNIGIPVTNENANFVVKIEPHSNGPLFVEIHCLMNTAKKNSNNDSGELPQHKPNSAAATLAKMPPSGIPDYIASGSHYFGDARYRFLVLQRYDRDLHSLIKNCRVQQKSVLTLAIQIVNVLEKLHDKGYCHNDMKAQNLMISKCKYLQTKQSLPNANGSGKAKYNAEQYDEKQQTTDSGNSSEQEANDEDGEWRMERRNDYNDASNDTDRDEYYDEGNTSHSNDSNSMDLYRTPINKSRSKRSVRQAGAVEYSGSNPVRTCRREKRNSIYEEMVKSHYLRPSKRVSYSEFFNEDGAPVQTESHSIIMISSDEESDEFVPQSVRRNLLSNKKSASATTTTTNVGESRRLTRRQEKLLAKSSATKTKTTSANQPQLQQQPSNHSSSLHDFVTVEEERIFLIDFGLASKFMDNGVHRPFVMDQRRAHDGTLEFTSRDAHMGAHSRRSDLECLGYNLIFWSQGYLPWKEAATQHQQEKVHRAKEYLMTDVREMLKQIYGKLVPKYLGEFLHSVGQLAYHERPDYGRYRRIFEGEFQQLGYSLADMKLDSHEIVRTCVRVVEEIENKNDIFEMNKHKHNVWSNFSVGTPFHELTLSNRVSPKNLRSKSDKKAMKKKKFSWAEILSQDPDQIARERAEKEFDREEDLVEVQQPAVRRFEGKPTYAILEIQQRLKLSGRLVEESEQAMEPEEEDGEEEEEEQKEEEDDKMNVCEEEDGDEEADDDDEEEESVHDDDDDNEDPDEDMETDVSGASEAHVRHVRTRRTRNVSGGTAALSTKKSKSKSNSAEGRTRGKRTSAKCTTRTRTRTSFKRGSATRGGGGRKAASAAGEVELSTQRYLENGGAGGGGAGAVGKPSERRARRCLIKTDAGEEVRGQDDESNSNFSPDVRSLFNVWKKINNETMYFRGSSAAAARHCKK